MRHLHSVVRASRNSSRFSRFRLAAEIAAAVLLLSAGAAAAATSSVPSGLTGSRIHGCANARTGAVSIVLKSGGFCPAGTDAVYWNSALLGSKTDRATGGSGGATCTMGQVILTAGTTAPAGTLPADGRRLSIASNTALFSLLRTQYGGDGRITFALPDLRAAAPNGLSYSVCVLGIYP